MYRTFIKPVRLEPRKITDERLMIQFIMSGGQDQFLYSSQDTPKFITVVEEPSQPYLHITEQVQIQMNLIQQFFDSTQFLEDKSKFYRQFKIPKRKGGFRDITAPCEHLKMMQTMQKHFLEEVLNILPHNVAHAYTKQRGIKTNAQVHQQSRYFLNLDMKDFFPSHNKEFVRQQLLNIHPLTYYPEYVTLLIELAELNDGLPQGTPLSPLLTNLCCMDLDYKLVTELYHYYNQREGTKAHILYTRYADDCTFSSIHHVPWHEVIAIVNRVLRENHYPYVLHPDKVRFSTNKGKNRVTGLKVNAKNQVTVGHDEKRELKNQIHNVLRDVNENNYPRKDVVTRLVGWLAFLHDIEPGYYQFLSSKYTPGDDLIRHLNQILSRY